MEIEKVKYPYPGDQKYYQMTEGTNNTKTTTTPHTKYYSTEEIDSMIKDVVNKIVTSKHVVVESCTFADLPEPTEDTCGIIYNVTDGFVTDDKFVDGPGRIYPSGTNVIIMKSGDQYMYDVMMGEIDAVDDSGIQDIIDSL